MTSQKPLLSSYGGTHMTAQEFLEKLKEKTGGKIIREDIDPMNYSSSRSGPLPRFCPRLYADYKKHYIKVDFIDAGEILFEVNMGTPHMLLIRPENVVSKLLDKINLSPEVKIGDASFDTQYIIQNVSEENAKKTINEKFKLVVKSLEPFVEFEMTGKEYRLLKMVDIASDYTPEKAVFDLDALMELVDVIKAAK